MEKKPEELHPDSRRQLEDASGINKNPPIRCKEKRRDDRQGGSAGAFEWALSLLDSLCCVLLRTQSHSGEDLLGSGSTGHISGGKLASSGGVCSQGYYKIMGCGGLIRSGLHWLI